MLNELRELQNFVLKFQQDVKLVFSITLLRMDKSNSTENSKELTNCLKKTKFGCIYHTNTTEDQLNAYGINTNGYGTRFLTKNLISGAHKI